MSKAIQQAWTGALVAGVLVLGATLTGMAATRGVTMQGQPYVEGGAGAQDTALLQAERTRYSLLVMTATGVAGADLAGVRLRITTTPTRQVVFERRLGSPWLLVELRPGDYTIEARYGGQVQRQPATVGAGLHQELVFYFDAAEPARPD